MGKIIPRSACSFAPTTGVSSGLLYGPQDLNDEPWQSINLTVDGGPCSVRLDEPGTYLLLGRIQFGGNFQTGDVVLYGLMDSEQELEIGQTASLKVPAANGQWEQEFTRIHTINSPRTVFLYANNNSGNRGSVIGLRTGIWWVRLN
ncbi:MAG: hypothetical protein ACK4UN_05615 [Limisphaerales bacterium]